MEDYNTRVANYFKIINPIYSVYTDNYISILQKSLRDQNLKNLESAVIHKDTKQPIFWLFRFSSFIPVNIPICFGLITSKTIYGQMFWQVINQSYNVGFNYANKPKNKPASENQLINMYSFAVASSCTISGLITHFTKNLYTNNSHITNTLLRGFIPFTSVFLSSTLNLYFVRQQDFNNGIQLYDDNNNEAGLSKISAVNSFTETATCRSLFRFASCVIPPLFEYCFMKNTLVESIMKTNPKMWTCFRVLIITSCLYISMPLSFAYYPQMMKINDNVELEFKNKPLYYNRGI